MSKSRCMAVARVKTQNGSHKPLQVNFPLHAEVGTASLLVCVGGYLKRKTSRGL